MSFQGMTWAIAQKTGSPRAKCVLMSIGNYANQDWCAWPSQELIGKESEQSVDSVQKYLADLIAASLVRRIKLKRFGRRTHDFFILPPSPVYRSPIEDIMPLLPTGCDVMDDATATDGSVQTEESAKPPQDSEIDATAAGGSVLEPTLPPLAVDATDVQRQLIDEPVMNQESLTQTLSQEKEATEADQETWKRFEQFKRDYPIPIFDVAAASRWFEPLSVADQELALIGAVRYGHECTRLKRRPKDAHRFLRDRLFAEFADRANEASAILAADSPEAIAVKAIYTVAGKGFFVDSVMRSSSGGTRYPKAIPPQLLALANAPPERQWAALDHRQATAWQALIDAFVTVKSNRLVQGSRAPWPWPPRKDGSLSTAPPPDDDPLADESSAALQKTG